MTREEAWRRTKGYLYDALSGEEADEIIKALEQEPCEDTISRECNNCAYYVNGANDEACDGCFADEYEHPNFKPKAQSCDDAISRQAVSSWLKQYGQDVLHGKYKLSLTYIWKNIMGLPPVNSQEKTGHWIIIDDCEQFIAKCSECGKIVDSRMISNYPYCHCGAKMQESKVENEG